MPDWILHIGAADALARPRARFDPRWLFLGAVLPDAIPRVAAMALHVFPPLRPFNTLPVGLWLGMLHTPVSVALLATALIGVAADRRAAAVGLAVGAALHFAMDLLQRTWGGGTSLLYPVELQPISLQALWYDSTPVHAAVGVVAVYLLLALRRMPVRRDFPFAWSRRRANLAAGALATALLLPGLCLPRAVEQNLGNAQLARAPQAFEGRAVQLAVTVVQRAEGDVVYVDEADTLFAVDWRGRPPVTAGTFVSLQGVFERQRIVPSEVFVHDYRFKMLASLGGLVVLVLVWLPSLRPTSRSSADPARAADPSRSCR